jgi:hypothetical protein
MTSAAAAVRPCCRLVAMICSRMLSLAVTSPPLLLRLAVREPAKRAPDSPPRCDVTADVAACVAVDSVPLLPCCASSRSTCSVVCTKQRIVSM